MPRLRLGARVDGVLVAVGHAGMDVFQAEQHEASVRIYVLPDHRGHGIGSALHERLAAFVREQGLITIISRVDAGDATSLAFAERRGLRVHGMQQLGVFDLVTVDLGQPPALPDGVSVVALEERPDLHPAVFDLLSAAIPEVPSLADLAPPSFETWREMQLEPSYRHDLSLIAIDEEGVAGHIEVTDDGDRRAFISMLAVAPRARRRGIARGLKVALAHRAANRWLARAGDNQRRHERADPSSQRVAGLPVSAGVAVPHRPGRRRLTNPTAVPILPDADPRPAATTSRSPSPRTSAAGACRHASTTSRASASPDLRSEDAAFASVPGAPDCAILRGVPLFMDRHEFEQDHRRRHRRRPPQGSRGPGPVRRQVPELLVRRGSPARVLPREGPDRDAVETAHRRVARHGARPR